MQEKLMRVGNIGGKQAKTRPITQAMLHVALGRACRRKQKTWLQSNFYLVILFKIKFNFCLATTRAETIFLETIFAIAGCHCHWLSVFLLLWS